MLNFQEKLKKEMEKNEQLQKELEEAKKEIGLVKKRNKTLCSMLSQGESKFFLISGIRNGVQYI